MNQYTAPMPGHFMWHLFSIPLLGTKSWPGASAPWPISLSQGWGMQSALGFISFALTTAWLSRPLSFPRSLDVYLSERMQSREEKKGNCLQALYRRAATVYYGIMSPVVLCQHYTSSVVLIHIPSFSRPFLCFPASLVFFPEIICLPSLSFSPLSLFLILSYCSTTGISLSH